MYRTAADTTGRKDNPTVILRLTVSGVDRILSQNGHGVRVHEIKQESLHKYNKLEK